MFLYSTLTRQSGLNSLRRIAFFIVLVQHTREQYSGMPAGRTHWIITTSFSAAISSG